MGRPVSQWQPLVAVAKPRLSSLPTPPPCAPHQDWDGFTLSTEGGEDVPQEGTAGEEKLKSPSHRMCGRNLSQP